MPIQRRLETCFISSDLFGPGEMRRNSGCGIARHVGQNATKKIAKSHISSSFDKRSLPLFSFESYLHTVLRSITIIIDGGIRTKDELMRGFLINKNLCFYYWLRKRIGKNHAFRVVNRIEKVILIFGRETKAR